MEKILKCLEFEKYIVSLDDENFDNSSMPLDIDSNTFIDNLDRLFKVNPNFCYMIGKVRRNILRKVINYIELDDEESMFKKSKILDVLNRSDNNEETLKALSFIGNVSYYDASHNPSVFFHKFNDAFYKEIINNMNYYRRFIDNATLEINFLSNVMSGNTLYRQEVLGDRKSFPETINYLLMTYPNSFDRNTLQKIKEILVEETYSSHKSSSISDKVSYLSTKRKVLKKINKL